MIDTDILALRREIRAQDRALAMHEQATMRYFNQELDAAVDPLHKAVVREASAEFSSLIARGHIGRAVDPIDRLLLSKMISRADAEAVKAGNDIEKLRKPVPTYIPLYVERPKRQKPKQEPLRKSSDGYITRYTR